VAGYARSGGISNNQFAVKFTKVKKSENPLRFDGIIAVSLWRHFLAHAVEREWPDLFVGSDLVQIVEVEVVRFVSLLVHRPVRRSVEVTCTQCTRLSSVADGPARRAASNASFCTQVDLQYEQLASTVAVKVNLARPTTGATLLQWASTFVELSWQHVATIDVPRRNFPSLEFQIPYTKLTEYDRSKDASMAMNTRALHDPNEYITCWVYANTHTPVTTHDHARDPSNKMTHLIHRPVTAWPIDSSAVDTCKP